MELVREKVEELYLGRKMSIAKCAKEFGVSYSKMNKYLESEGIKVGFKKNDVPDISTVMSQNIKAKKNSVKKVTEDKSTSIVEKSSVPKEKKSKSCSSTPKKEKEITLQDKIIYCNRKYGYNCWRFMERDEIKEALMMDYL